MIRSRGSPFVKHFSLGFGCFAMVLVGAKLLYLAEAGLFPEDDYVPHQLRGMQHGFRIPGGVLLLALGLPITSRALEVSWRDYGDRLVVVVAVMLVIVRIGCFLNGCCFGVVSDLPWAVSFPNTSWVYFFQVTRGLIPPGTERSLPVHPLQLYFVAAAFLALVLVLRLRHEGAAPGEAQLTFYPIFFGSTLLLEPLRANHLTINNWLALSATSVVARPLLRIQRRTKYADAGVGTHAPRLGRK